MYVIDGYNIIHHPAFSKSSNKVRIPPQELLRLIRTKRLCGKNRATVVFDGYPPAQEAVHGDDEIGVVFSKDHSADEKIKILVERARNPKNIVVVSDDNEVKFIAKALGAKVLGVEQFISQEQKSRAKAKETAEIELTYSQMEAINKELRKIWLK